MKGRLFGLAQPDVSHGQSEDKRARREQPLVFPPGIIVRLPVPDDAPAEGALNLVRYAQVEEAGLSQGLRSEESGRESVVKAPEPDVLPFEEDPLLVAEIGAERLGLPCIR